MFTDEATPFARSELKFVRISLSRGALDQEPHGKPDWYPKRREHNNDH